MGETVHGVIARIRRRSANGAFVGVVLLFGAACGASGGDGGGGGQPDAFAPGDTNGKESTGGGCIFPCDVPAPSCSDDCSSIQFVSAGCTEAGTCAFTTRSVKCDFGCDKATGACTDGACKTTVCGAKTACGGICGTGTGCCSEVLYDETTGLAPSGSRACCHDGDTFVSGSSECGTGVNHGWNQDGLCAVCWEGAGNGGTPCATAHCKTLKCGPGG